MTHRATAAHGGRGAYVGAPRIWLLPISVAAGMVFVTAAGWLSPSIILDFLAWWPLWVLLIGLVFAAKGRRLWKVRLSAVVPVVATAALVVFTAGHLLGWPAMPSSSQRLVGPIVGSEPTAALSARVDGAITLIRGSDFLYEVDAIRRGGEIGIPSASEQVQGSNISILLEAPLDPGFYAFAGWNIILSDLPTWNLTLDGEIDADFGGLDVSGFQVFGSGNVTLGQATGIIPATVAGTFELVIPSGVAARVVGEAFVPQSWDPLSDGAKSPTAGDGWVISVPVGSTVTVTEG